MSGTRTFGGPLRYVQGPAALDSIGEIVAVRHRVAAVLVDETLAEALVPRLLGSLAAHGVDAAATPVSGQVTQERILSLAQQLSPPAASVVIAVGGGKTLDIGKG